MNKNTAPKATKNASPAALALAECAAATEALANNDAAKALLTRLIEAQKAADDAGVWETREARATEAAMGYLRMALEAVGADV